MSLPKCDCKGSGPPSYGKNFRRVDTPKGTLNSIGGFIDIVGRPGDLILMSDSFLVIETEFDYSHK